jgi:hypothetical protein
VEGGARWGLSLAPIDGVSMMSQRHSGPVDAERRTAVVVLFRSCRVVLAEAAKVVGCPILHHL